MKNIKYFTLVVIFIVSSTLVISQTIYDASTSDNTSNDVFPNVVNTGNDIKLINEATFMEVMVCDGDSPQFVWHDTDVPTNGEEPISTRTCGNNDITDPDVVCVTDGADKAIIVFECDGDIYYMIKSYSGGYWSNVGPYSLGGGSNPNIDIEIHDYFVITWQNSSDEIKALAGRYDGTNFTMGTTTTVYTTADAYTPDVTVYENDGDTTVTFTYITGTVTLAGTHYLHVHQESFGDVFGNNISNSPSTIKTVNSGELLGRPRIASPEWWSGSTIYVDHDDYHIVVGYKYVDQVTYHDILGFNSSTGSTTQNISYCGSPDILSYLNEDPVVTYSGDYIIPAWTSEADGGGNEDVISRQCDYDGATITGYYSIVNYDKTDDQMIGSVSGRGCGTVFYTFFDDPNSAIFYKTSSPGSQQIRKKNPDLVDTEKKFLPLQNPIADKIDLLFDENSAVRIYNYNGKLVYQKDYTPGNAIINIENFENGIYLLNIRSNIVNETKKIVILN